MFNKIKMKTFLLILISYICIKLSSQQCKTGQVSNSASACFQFSTSSTDCCFISLTSNFYSTSSQGMCYSQSAVKNFDQETIKYNQTSYYIMCSNDIDLICGIPYPQIDSDCKKYSNDSDSCCFYKYGDKSGCFWYGQKFKGETTQANLYLSCFGSRIKLDNIYYFVFIFICGLQILFF